MIGQKELIEETNYLISNNKLPRFVIIQGTRGSGKSLICDEIANKLGANHIKVGTKVDEIREMQELAVKVTSPTVYTILDAQQMSQAAQNSMLKITEEPPKNAYFIMTVENENQILNTLISRGTLLQMRVYSSEELLKYAKEYLGVDVSNYEDFISSCCTTPYDIECLVNSGIDTVKDYVEMVVDRIANVSGANSFKIADKINIDDKDESTTKIDLILFWRCFITECAKRLKDNPFKYQMGIKITVKYLSQLGIVGVNKKSTFDMWLLDIRQDWMAYEEE